MELDLPILYYHNQEEVVKNSLGEEELKTVTYKIHGRGRVNPLDIQMVTSAPGTDISVAEVTKMRCSRIWLKSGASIDINLPYNEMVDLWEKGKEQNYKVLAIGIKN